MGTKPNEVKEAITPHITKKNIDIVNKTDKSQASNEKQIHPAAINLTTVNHWINKGLIKELTHKTKLTKKINQGLFRPLVYLYKVPKQKNHQKQISEMTIQVFLFFWTRKMCIQCNFISTTYSSKEKNKENFRQFGNKRIKYPRTSKPK